MKLNEQNHILSHIINGDTCFKIITLNYRILHSKCKPIDDSPKHIFPKIKDFGLIIKMWKSMTLNKYRK